MSRIRFVAALVASAAALSSCGGNDTSANLKMLFSPSKSYLLPGTGSSCADYLNAQTSTTGLAASVSQYRLVYPQFSLAWNSSDLLFVSYINVTLKGSNIQNGSFTAQLTNTDIEPMLGISPGSAFNGTLYPFAGSPKSISTAVVRTAQGILPGQTATTTINFPACPFTVGGVSLIDASRGFGGQVTVELIGFSVANDGTQSPVKKTQTLQFKYPGT